MSLFHGLSAFPLTPTSGDGQLREDLLRRFLDRLVAAGVDSIGLLGSTGGYAFLSQEQRQRAVAIAVEHVGGRVPVVVGVGALRTATACELARHAQEAGADGLLLAPMSYVPLRDEEVFQHFAAVADAGRLPLCIYSNPGTTRFTFSSQLIARLAPLPHIAAIKMPLPAGGEFTGELAELRGITPEGFAIGYSGDWGAADALLAGCDAWFSVVAGLLPDPALALTRAAQAGDSVRASQINAAFETLWELFKEHGSFRVMYAIAGALGLDAIDPPRPVLPIPAGEHQRLKAALDRLEALTPIPEDGALDA